MTKQDPVEGRRELKGDEPGNHDETRSSRRRQRKTNPEIMTKQDPIEGQQRETNGDKPGNHDETRSSRRETKGDKGR